MEKRTITNAKTGKYSLSLWLGLLVLCTLPLWPFRVFQAPSTVVEHHQSLSTNLIDDSDLPTNHSLVRRDEYNCGPKNPCKNGACCGESGYCGYGPTYCGKGCVSNCGAKAECGKYAKESGKECPLNTCCSEFGFCGTTKDFCGKKCQSNCVLNPKPPAGGSKDPILKRRVIGYYESWSARKDCHKVGPKDLPLDALTHVNYAFAYIDPGNLQITTMDGDTPANLFADTTSIKSLKPDLSVWISVGGWTFSDNGTKTQPLFSDIAADEGKRKDFANNAVKFMKQYGFDGIDLDWEYPGAPDRGGKKEDTDNYVALMKTLRETFDSSGGKYGLTFTAPSSYWYLRWFDLPGLIKYTDWINFMTYDLHGVWDATNPIGSIVQGHTNLTEIKLATELFWRVKVPPEKLVMGFGFYGRSFQLADAGCSKPGCPFKGASKPGACTDTGGILSHYEIQDILDGKTSRKRDKVTPVHDKESAVNYFIYDNDQWVSYDDKTTFKQKTDWADEVGLGGAMIWASDLDDKKSSAHAALLGRDIKNTATLEAETNQNAIMQNLAGSMGQKCFAFKDDCVDLNNNDDMNKACGTGFTPVGWDDAGCGHKNHHYGKPICCPVDQAPKSCTWRGNGRQKNNAPTDCTGQCLAGEVNINGIGSSYGGGFLNDGNTNKCGRGRKVFCCASSEFGQLTKGCSLTAGCHEDCPGGTEQMFTKFDTCLTGAKKYCCSKPASLKDCRWESGSKGTECVNAVCKDAEIAVAEDPFGDGIKVIPCQWGRSKVACCTPDEAPAPPASCSTDLCMTFPGYCPSDDNDEGANDFQKRDITDPEDFYTSEINLDKRGGTHPYYPDIPGRNLNIEILAAAYPAIGELFGTRNGANVLRRFFRLIQGFCRGNGVATGPIQPGPKPPVTGLQTEHPIDRQVMQHFAEATITGLLPSQDRNDPHPQLPTLGAFFWENQWRGNFPNLQARPRVGGPNGKAPGSPNDRVMQALGSNSYRDPFLPVDAQINGAKGRIMGLREPTAVNQIQALAETVVRTDNPGDADRLLSYLRVGWASFDYLNDPDAQRRWNMVRDQLRTQFGYIEQDLNIPNLVNTWDTFADDYFGVVERTAQDWAQRAIDTARTTINNAQNRPGGPGRQTAMILAQLDDFERAIPNMRLPAGTRFLVPQPGGLLPPGPGGPGSNGGGGSSSGGGSGGGGGS